MSIFLLKSLTLINKYKKSLPLKFRIKIIDNFLKKMILKK